MGVYDHVHIGNRTFQTKSHEYDPSMRALFLHHYEIKDGVLYFMLDMTEDVEGSGHERQYFSGELLIREMDKDKDNLYSLWMRDGVVKDVLIRPRTNDRPPTGLAYEKVRREDLDLDLHPDLLEEQLLRECLKYYPVYALNICRTGVPSTIWVQFFEDRITPKISINFPYDGNMGFEIEVLED